MGPLRRAFYFWRPKIGSKYTSQSATNYNSSPPADDGSTNASNRILWSSIKSKLGDPVKALSDAINSALVTALDTSARAVSSSDTAAASDHLKTIQVNTASVIITLSDAATMAAGYSVTVSNQSAGRISVTRATGGDTINGVAAAVTIHARQSMTFAVNAAADGYNIVARSGTVIAPTKQVFTSGSGTYTTPAGATYIRVRLVGAGGGGSGNVAGAATAGGDTTFDTLTGSGGAAGNNTGGGTGGATAGGDFGFPGGAGGGGSQISTAGNFAAGGHGGVSTFGGAGAQGVGNANGGNGATNTGSGGGGGGGATGGNSGGGGGAGGYVEKTVASPAATYSYGVGAGGAGSVGGATTGGTGAAGIIIVDEFYT